MAANPRKFSEKIALIRAKEAEADAAFHNILNEVSGITKAAESHIPPYPGHQLKPLPHGAPYAPFKTGSLPNIQHSLMQQMHPPMSPQMPPSAPGIDLKSAIHDLNSLNGGDSNRRRFMPPQYGGSPGVRPQRSRTTDHAPYSPYLTPHPLNAPECKKFKSDSDIHGSMKNQQQTNSEGNIMSPMIHRRVREIGGGATGLNNAIPHDMRGSGPKNFEGSPSNGMMAMPLRLPMPGMVPGSTIPMSPPHQNFHGSLPDLTTLGFNNNNQGHSPPGPGSPPVCSDQYGRPVSMPDSPSAMRANGQRQHSPLVGSPPHFHMQGHQSHFQYYPHPVMGHIGGGQQLSSIPQHKVNQQKQMVNETIRRRISDKMLAQQQAQYRNNDSMPSPSSPGTPPVRSPESVDSYVMSPGSQQQLQHQFEQVTMDNHNVITSMSSMYTNGSIPTTAHSQFIMEHHRLNAPVKQHSIPDIVLTGADDGMRGDFAKELSQSMSDSFDNDMFGSDEHFKTDLTPLDLEGLQMLEDPNNVLTDPGTEDQLRLC